MSQNKPFLELAGVSFFVPVMRIVTRTAWGISGVGTIPYTHAGCGDGIMPALPDYVYSCLMGGSEGSQQWGSVSVVVSRCCSWDYVTKKL